eukprot:NODE_8303_length_390_cov_0.716418.p2 GENE.NODE_8303_length_390_cov_0.716418~~NODE_8303_length_390_cov_0.716418.p2  ORF type:complete len:93 (+),score=21.39 NODE_8303_length_390_cov_0.716418:99-377(+)
MCGHKYSANEYFPMRLVLLAENTAIDEHGTVRITEVEDEVSACYIGEPSGDEEKCLQLLKVLPLEQADGAWREGSPQRTDHEVRGAEVQLKR